METDTQHPSLENRPFGRYIIQRKLGAGGAATVYQAYDQVLGRTVALKILGTAGEDAALNRFQREALTAGRLEHPNIVRTLQVGLGKQGGAPYIAMELVEGESLAQLLARVGRLSPADSCRLLAPIGRALAYAHTAGIVHRDVKPSNVLLQPVPARPSRRPAHFSPGIELDILGYPVHPLLSDFGIARALDAPELTHIGRTVGTPAYMSPEQCAGSRTIDGRTDMYALGAVLFRCILGHPPFGGTTHQILHAHVYSPLTLDATALDSLPPQVITLLRQSLAKSADERFSHIEDMVILMDEVAQMHPTSPVAANGSKIDATQTLEIPLGSEPPAATTVLVPAPPTDTRREPSLPAADEVPTAPSPLQTDPEHRAAYAWSRRIPAHVLALAVFSIMLATLWTERDRLMQTVGRSTTQQAAITLDTKSLVPPQSEQETGNPAQPGDSAGETLPSSAPHSTETPDATAGQVAPSADLAPVHLPAPPETAAQASVPAEEPANDAEVAPTPLGAATPIPTAVPAPFPPLSAEPSPDESSPDESLPEESLPEESGEATTSPEAEPGAPLEPLLAPTDPQAEAEGVIACAATVDEFFLNHPDLAETGPAGLLTVASFACPSEAASASSGYIQRFAYGSLIQMHDQPFVYVYYQQTGAWEQAVVPSPRASEEPATELSHNEVDTAFLRLWEAPHRMLALGEPLDPVPAEHAFVLQRYPHGLLIGDRDANRIYILLRDRLRL